MNLILIGFRGAGKSVVGKRVAERLGMNFLDLDEVIEKEFGGSILEIFEKEGEEGFRERECRALEACRGVKKSVIAVGGGAVLREANREFLKKLGMLVYLNVSPGEAFKRIKTSERKGSRRPSLTGLSMDVETEVLISKREPIYRSIADFEIDTHQRSVEGVAGAVIECLKGLSLGQGGLPHDSEKKKTE